MKVKILIFIFISTFSLFLSAQSICSLVHSDGNNFDTIISQLAELRIDIDLRKAAGEPGPLVNRLEREFENRYFKLEQSHGSKDLNFILRNEISRLQKAQKEKEEIDLTKRNSQAQIFAQIKPFVIRHNQVLASRLEISFDNRYVHSGSKMYRSENGVLEFVQDWDGLSSKWKHFSTGENFEINAVIGGGARVYRNNNQIPQFIYEIKTNEWARDSQVSSDGKIALLGTFFSRKIEVYKYDQSVELFGELTFSKPYQKFQISNDGKILVVMVEHDLYLYDISNAPFVLLKNISSGINGPFGDIRFSDNGNYLSVVSNNGLTDVYSIVDGIVELKSTVNSNFQGTQYAHSRFIKDGDKEYLLVVTWGGLLAKVPLSYIEMNAEISLKDFLTE